jgi:hypothetical protein
VTDGSVGAALVAGCGLAVGVVVDGVVVDGVACPFDSVVAAVVPASAAFAQTPKANAMAVAIRPNT